MDIGGTFTDFVLLNASDGEVVTEKVLTTPEAPLDAVRRGIGAVLEKAQQRAPASGNNISPAEITAPIVHATTLVTNALIEGRTAKAGLVTTKGFGDTLLIRDEHRYDMYDLQIEFAEPPIPRERTVEIDERTLAAPAKGTKCSARLLAKNSAKRLRSSGKWELRLWRSASCIPM